MEDTGATSESHSYDWSQHHAAFQALFVEHDTDKSGTLDYEQWLTFISALLSETSPLAAIGNFLGSFYEEVSTHSWTRSNYSLDETKRCLLS